MSSKHAKAGPQTVFRKTMRAVCEIVGFFLVKTRHIEHCKLNYPYDPGKRIRLIFLLTKLVTNDWGQEWKITEMEMRLFFVQFPLIIEQARLQRLRETLESMIGPEAIGSEAIPGMVRSHLYKAMNEDMEIKRRSICCHEYPSSLMPTGKLKPRMRKDSE